ncbi:MAG TPA: hypothetical protein VGM80_13135 [Gaiellaceae bacterium]
MTRLAALCATALALALAASAAAVGPSLPDVTGAVTVGEVSYVTSVRGSHTLLTRRLEGRAVARTSLAGDWGIPLVTLTGGVRGGLSRDGRILVLGDNVSPSGALRPRSRFAVIDARSLTLTRTIALRGDYSFDALSPTGRWLYLIHHLESTENRYQVQVYDLQAGRLLQGVIADKSQAGWLMAGYPVARATGAGGRWVYTLYEQNGNYPFVHALDTMHRTAICIGLPWDWASPTSGIGAARLELTGNTLEIAGGTTHFALNTTTFRVTGS